MDNEKIILDKEDFSNFLEVETQLIATGKTIRELVQYRGVLEKLYHEWWTETRNKYKLDIKSNYHTDRQTGEIIKNSSERDTQIYHVLNDKKSKLYNVGECKEEIE